MKYFIDTEFLEGKQDKRFLGIKYGETKPTIDLISIGIVCEDGREYYAISKDFNLKEAWNRYQLRTGQGDYNNINPREYWIKENVLKPIWNKFVAEEFKTDILAYNECTFSYSSMKRLIKKYGKTNKQIAEEIKDFIIHKNNPVIWQPIYEVTKDTNWTYNERIEQLQYKYPSFTPQFYGYYSDYDWVVFCWLFGRMIDLPRGFPMYCIDLKQELDNYVSTGKKLFKTLPRQTNEHNALRDARWNYELYKFLQQL